MDIFNTTVSSNDSNLFLFSRHVCKMYSYAPYIIGIPQACLNTGVVLTLLSGFIFLNHKWNPGLAYLLNLALCDLCHAAVLSLITGLYTPAYCYSPIQEENQESLVTGCKLYVSSWSFVYIQSTIATVVLTIDRYIRIARPLHYNMIVNKRRVIISICLCWIIPLILTVSGFFTSSGCITPHLGMGNKFSTTIVAAVVALVLLGVHSLYIRIIFSFWKMKRKKSRVFKTRSTIQDSQEDYKSLTFTSIKANCLPIKQSKEKALKRDRFEDHGLTFNVQQYSKQIKNPSLVLDQVSRFGRYLKASNYVLVILLTFTLCWLPWVCTFLIDLINHESGGHEEYIINRCGFSNQTTSQNTAKFNRSLFLCFENHAMDVNDCDWTKFEMSDKELCWTFYELLHQLKFDSVEHILIYVGALNSLLNPFIYGLWYSDFRFVAHLLFMEIRKKSNLDKR